MTSVVCLFSFAALCQTQVSLDSVSRHVGEKVTVCGRVFGTRFLSQSASQPTFLNMGAAFPDNPLTVVIFGDDRKNFSKPPEELYAGKSICVTGIVKQYKGKAEIIIDKQEEITVEK